MEREVTGSEAIEAFNTALAYVKAGDYASARAVNLYPSDRVVIEDKIKKAVAASANTTKE